MSLSISKAYVGITTNLVEFGETKPHRSTPDVRLSYERADGTRIVETICPYGARILAKALKEMADLAEPPRKTRRA